MLSVRRSDSPREPSRAVRVNLAIVLAFAFTAVVMLTSTLISTTRIDDDVATAINPNLGAVGDDTMHLSDLDRTAELVRAIAAATVPLDPPLASSARLFGEAAAILHDIRANTPNIGAAVSGIDPSVAAPVPP